MGLRLARDIVAPGKRYRVLVQYELPQVGKLLFTLDNAGAGYLVDQAGGRSELNLNREIARSSLASVASLERGRDAPRLQRRSGRVRNT